MLIFLLILCTIGIMSLVSQGKRREESIKRMEVSQRRVEVLAQLNATGTSVEHPLLSAAVLKELAAGNKIGAIKQYRTETGIDLRTAKETIELAELLGPALPRK